MSASRMLRRKAAAKAAASKFRIHYREDGRIVSSSSAPYDTRFVCKHCGANQQSFAALRNHERVHTGERPFKCDLCTKCFKMPHHLYDHKRTHTGEKPFACQYCDKKFVQRSNLRQHEQTVHPEEKHYPCQHCTERFQNKHELKDHHLWHLEMLRRNAQNGKGVPEIEPYACRYCPTRFFKRSKLNIHIRWHLDGNKDEPPPSSSPSPPPSFQLDMDNSQEILDEDDRLIHRKLHRNIPLVSDPEPDCMIVKCRLCPRKFSRSSALKAHMTNVHMRDFEDFKRPNILRPNTLSKFSPSHRPNPNHNANGFQTQFGNRLFFRAAPNVGILKSSSPTTRFPKNRSLFASTSQPMERSRIRTEPQPFHASILSPTPMFDLRVPLNEEEYEEEMDESENFGDDSKCQFCYNGLARASSTDYISCGHCNKSERENSARINANLVDDFKPISIVESSNPSIFETVEMKYTPNLDLVENVTVKVEMDDLNSILGM